MICVVLLIVFYYPFNFHGIPSVPPLSLLILVRCVFFLITRAKIISNLLIFSKKSFRFHLLSCFPVFNIVDPCSTIYFISFACFRANTPLFL